MSKMKRILALTLCILLAITSLPVTQLVFADETETQAIDLNEDGVLAFEKTFNYSSVEDAKNDGWTVKDNAHTEFAIEGGAPTLKQIKRTVTEDNKKATGSYGTTIKYKFPAGPVWEDAANRTSLITLDGKYTGKVKVDVDAQLDLLPTAAYKYTHTYMDGNEEKTTTFTVNISFAVIDIIGDKTAVNWRLRPEWPQAMSSTDEAKSDIKDETGNKRLGGVPKDGHVLSATIDTVDETVSATVPVTGNGSVATGSTWAKLSSKADLTYVDSISLAQMIRLDVGSYSKINGVTVTTLDPKFGTETADMMDTLPEKLAVDNINAVTTAEFELPEINGVVWESSDSSVISIDGKKAAVNRVKGEAKEVTVKATFTTDGIRYSKEYDMTVAAGDNIVKYYDINGDLFSTDEVTDGEKALDILAPSIEHYDFIGWYEKDSDTEFDFNNTLNNHLSLYAKYEPKTYNVVFKADGNEVAVLSGKYNSTIEGEIPEIPEKSGYTPICWVIGDSENVFDSDTVITEPDMIVNAKYTEGTVEKYTVTFMVDGNVYETETVFEGFELTLPDIPVKANYTFAYWTLNGEKFDEESSITSDITLEAEFNPNPITVKFYMDEEMKELYGEGTGYYNMPYGEVPVPAKDKHKFTGWKLSDGTDFTAETVVTEVVSVYATWESLVKVLLEEDLGANGSLDSKFVKIFNSGENTEVTYDKGIKMSWLKEMPTSRTTDQTLILTLKVPYGSEDTKNRTQVYNNKLVGDYEIEVTMDVDLSDEKWNEQVTGLPMGYFSTGYSAGSLNFNTILHNRIQSEYISTFNNTTGSKSDFNATNTLNKATKFNHSETSTGTMSGGGYENVVSRIRYNTAKNYAEMTAPGYPDTVAHGSGANMVNGINAIRFQMMACFAPGDYFRIKKIKVTQLGVDTENPDYIEALNIIDNLPETIVSEGDTPYNVTNTLNIPKLKGVAWTSSEPDIVNVNNGEITRWYDAQNVIVTATVTVGNYTFSKDYELTIAPFEAISKNTILDETFTSEADMGNWTFVSLADGEIADYTVDENGVKIIKTTASDVTDSSVEEKRYFAYYDLYTEVKNDTYTTTSTKDVKGVYDVTLDLGEYLATSNVNMNVGIGYRKDTTFYPYGSIVFDEKGVKFEYNENSATTKRVELVKFNENSLVKLRVDNILGEITLFVDDEVVIRTKSDVVANEEFNLNTVRASIDVNNNIGDFVTVKGVKVEKVVENEVSTLKDVLAAADSLTVNTVTSNPDAVSAINVLPSTIGKYKIDWKSSSKQIDVETREVFFDTTAKPATVTAEIYDADAACPVVVRKNFNIMVRAASNNQELGQFEIAKLGKITNQNYSDIRYDLNLPESENVVWTSSRTDIITNDGKIIDTVVLTEPTPVTFTATSNGVSKPFNLVVAPRTEQVELSSGTLPLSIKLTNKDNAKVSADVTAKFTYTHSASNTGKVNVVNDNGQILASMVITEKGIYFDYKNSDYKEIALTEGQVVNIEFVVMPDVDRVAVFVDGILSVDYKELKVATDYVAGVNVSDGEVNAGEVKLTVNKYGLLQANMDNFDYFADAQIGYATKDGISLPTDIISNGKLTWISSNEELLAADGKVTEPEVLTYAELEFKLEDTEDSRIFISKKFNIAVDCNNNKNVVADVVPKITNIKSSEYPTKNVSDNDIETAMKLTDSYKENSEIVFELDTEKTFNSVYVFLTEKGLEDFEIHSSDDGQMWNKIGTFNMEDDFTKFIKFNAVSAKYIKFVVNKTYATDVFINEIKVYLTATAEELASLDIERVTVPAIAEGSKINLPSNGINGTEFTWTSSHENIISTNGNITRPSNATTVTLTVKAVVDGKEFSRTFDVYVDTKSTSGPSQVGGGSGGGGGGGGMSSGGAVSTPVIGGNEEDTVYTEDTNKEESTTPSASMKYNDVKETDWYFEAVNTLTEKGVVSGDGSGEFKPNDKVTREQFVKMILEALGIEAVKGENNFTDVSENAWYVDYIITASELGIVNGLAETHFGIGSNISRQDMAVLIERVLKYKKLEVEKADVEAFADAAEVADYAKDAVSNMKAIGLIQGYNNNYNPKDNLTRAEAATVISSLLELLAK